MNNARKQRMIREALGERADELNPVVAIRNVAFALLVVLVTVTVSTPSEAPQQTASASIDAHAASSPAAPR